MEKPLVRVGITKWTGTAAAVLLCNMAAGTTYYVAPNGNDAWSGLLAEANAAQSDGPLASLEGARLKVRDAITKDASIPITVMFRGGEYRLLETVVFSPADAGSQKAPITYKAYRDERPVFTGGIKLTEWKNAGDDPEECHPNAKGRLWICDLPQELKGKWQITSLYDGTNLLPRARSGELKASEEQFFDGYNVQPKKLNLGRLGCKTGEAITFRRTLHYDGADLREWDNLADVEILTSPRNGWLVNYLPLESIDTDNRIATYGIDSTYSLMPNNNFVINCRGHTNSIRTETHLDRCILYAGPSGRPNLKSGERYIFDDIHRISNSLIYAPRVLEEKSLGKDLVPEQRRGETTKWECYLQTLCSTKRP